MNFTSTFTNIDCSQAHDVVGNKSFDNDLQSIHSNLTDSLLTQASSPVSPLTYIAFGLVCAIVILGLCGNLLTLAITLKFRNTLKGPDVLIIALVLCDCAAPRYDFTTPSNRDRLAQLGSFSTVATVLDDS